MRSQVDERLKMQIGAKEYNRRIQAAKHHYSEHEPTGERLGVSCANCTTDTADQQAEPSARPEQYVPVRTFKVVESNLTHCMETNKRLTENHALLVEALRSVLVWFDSHDELVDSAQDDGLRDELSALLATVAKESGR